MRAVPRYTLSQSLNSAWPALALVLIAQLVGGYALAATPPALINYQGVLRDAATNR